MKILSLRQLNGIVMIVNTFMPVIIIISIIWLASTSFNAIRNNFCNSLLDIEDAYKIADEEINKNQRARSAKLRVAEKLH